MDASILILDAHAAPPARADCYHCGLPLPGESRFTVLVDDVERAMCCAGCQAVAQTIVKHGLTSYYRHRSALPSRDDVVPELVRDLAAFDVPEVERSLVRSVDNRVREAALMLEGITCAACVWLIEQRVMREPGVLGMDINYATHRARVRWDSQHTRLAVILKAIAALGYRARPYDAARAENLRRSERNVALWRLFIAGFGMMQVMMYLVPVYLTNGEMSADIEQLMRIASLVLTLPVVLYSAQPFFAGAWRDARAHHPGMDVPVALGIAAAFMASVVSTVTGEGAVYFDSITMFVFLLLAARYFEMMARTRAAMTQEQLARQVPVVAERYASWPASGSPELVAAHSLQVGDYVRVRPGAAVPTDGVVVAGDSEIDERLLTGEARPQARHTGDGLTGGSFNIGGPLIMRATRVGSDTTLAGIMRLLDRAAGEKPHIAHSADRVAQYFVMALLGIATIVAAAWYYVDPQRALWITVAVLVVSCPCALSLATPAALAAATGALYSHGVLITRGNALENLARATHFVFDKTGTLTNGELKLVGVVSANREINCYTRNDSLALAAALEAGSSHPIARALTAAAPASVPHCSVCTHVAGSGVEGVIDGVRLRLGAPQFVCGLSKRPPPAELALVADDISVVALGDEHGWIALFTFADTLRPHAHFVIRTLAQMGKQVHLLSGDRIPAVGHIARELDITAWRGEATPSDKLEYIKRLQRQRGAVVAMIGDGINDVAGLAGAQLSVAIDGGAEVACGSSDVVLLSGRLDTLLAAVRTARSTLRVIHQNLAWAFAYNLVAIPLAASGQLTPLVAAAGMAVSSMLVVANALRLLRHGTKPAVPAAAGASSLLMAR